MASPSFDSLGLALGRPRWLRFGDRRVLWLLLSGLAFGWNVAVFWLSNQIETTQVLNLLLWLGIWMALEDQGPSLWPRPSRASAFGGTLLLVLTVARSSLATNNQDRFIYLVLPLLAIGLALLNRPPGQWRRFWKPLAIALLLPLSRLITNGALPGLLVPVTAKLTWVLLHALGFRAFLDGAEVQLGSGGVLVFGACAGIEQLIFTVSVVVIFLLLFPLERLLHIALVITASIVGAVLVNGVRIALLAYCTSWPAKAGMPAFTFLHDSYGSLLFSLVAVSIVGWIYLKLLDRELAA
jgi:cyanoexosortase A